METYNDDWCQCPICFEIYSIIHRPTTFTCGHSVCIDHVYGDKSLEECPICRYPLKSSDKYHISYSLEEAVRVFNSLKNSIYWNNLIKTETVEEELKKFDKKDDFYEEKLKRNELLLDEIYSSSNNASHNRSENKSRDHTCQLTTTHIRLFN